MSNKKIVCAVTNDLNQDRRMHRICTALAEVGYEVTLVGREKDDSQNLTHQVFNQYRFSLKHRSGPRFYYEYNQKLYRYLLKENPAMVYSVDTDTIMGCGRAVKSLGCRFVFDAHEYFTEVPELQNKPLKKWVWNIIQAKYIGMTDLRITVGEALAKILAKRDRKSYTVIRNVPKKRTQREYTKDKKFILYQGVLNKGRGLKAAVDSLSYIEDPEIELHLVGGGDTEQELQIYSESKEYRDRIVFHGWKYGEDLLDITNKAWLGLNLLETQSLNYYYSLANKFFDYLHSSVPSLNMVLPEYQSILQKYPTGIMIGELSPKSIAKVINGITESDYSRMQKACIKAQKVFNWDHEKETLLSVIHQLMKDDI